MIAVLTDCGDSGDDFTELELVENSGLSGGIETNHEDSHLLLAPQAVEQLGEGKTHVGGGLWWVVVVWRRKRVSGLVSCIARATRSAKVPVELCIETRHAPLDIGWVLK